MRVFALFLILLLAGCGARGPLHLPHQPAPQTPDATMPAP